MLWIAAAMGCLIASTFLGSWIADAFGWDEYPKRASASVAQGPRVTLGTSVVFQGACDASGAVSMNSLLFALADDEDNVIRVYDSEKGGAPLRLFNLAPLVPVEEEADLEAATRIGTFAYWLSSHGRNKKGKFKQERLLFLSTEMPDLSEDLDVVGKPYWSLVDALAKEPALLRFGLDRARQLPPKARGGLNIEGMTATPEGGILLGFRNPVPQGRALVVGLKNPQQVFAGEQPAFTPPELLDLGGLGVRALSWWHGDYYIVAGPIDSGSSSLFRWRGPGHEAEVVAFDLRDFNPEGFFTPEERDDFLLLSDDGAVEVDGKPCKSLKDDAKKRFRGVWVTFAAPLGE